MNKYVREKRNAKGMDATNVIFYVQLGLFSRSCGFLWRCGIGGSWVWKMKAIMTTSRLWCDPDDDCIFAPNYLQFNQATGKESRHKLLIKQYMYECPPR